MPHFWWVWTLHMTNLQYALLLLRNQHAIKIRDSIRFESLWYIVKPGHSCFKFFCLQIEFRYSYMKIGKHFYLLRLHCEMKGSSLKAYFPPCPAAFWIKATLFSLFIYFFPFAPFFTEAASFLTCMDTWLWCQAEVGPCPVRTSTPWIPTCENESSCKRLYVHPLPHN